MRCCLLISCVALLMGGPILSVPAQESPQGSVITDRSSVSKPSAEHPWPDNDGRQGPVMPRRVKGRRWELVLGVAAVGALLVFGLFRWQARSSRRSL